MAQPTTRLVPTYISNKGLPSHWCHKRQPLRAVRMCRDVTTAHPTDAVPGYKEQLVGSVDCEQQDCEALYRHPEQLGATRQLGLTENNSYHYQALTLRERSKIDIESWRKSSHVLTFSTANLRTFPSSRSRTRTIRSLPRSLSFAGLTAD